MKNHQRVNPVEVMVRGFRDQAYRVKVIGTSDETALITGGEERHALGSRWIYVYSLDESLLQRLKETETEEGREGIWDQASRFARETLELSAVQSG